MKLLLTFACILFGIRGQEPRSAAQEPEPSADQSRIVVRISRQFIRDRVMPTIAQEAPVQKFLFGAYVTGNSVTNGKTSVTMEQKEDEAVFTIALKGTVVSRTVATRRPVQIYSTGTTTFEARRQIRFDGVSFVEEPTTIEATHYCSTDGIAAPFGLIGAFARSAAWRRVRETSAACDAIALDDAKTQVLASFGKETGQLTQDLNRLAGMQDLLKLLAPRAKDWVIRLRSTPEFIMISPGPMEVAIPDLPREWVRMKAPVEVWVRGDPERKSARGYLELWNTLNRAKKSEKGNKVEQVVFTAVGDWWVLKLGEDFVQELMEKRDNGKVESPSNARR